MSNGSNDGRADLHTHTSASDGMQPPAENVRLAKAAGLAAVAITDHDTVAGVEEALQEGKRLGIVVVPGVEISTVLSGTDIHVLGYYIDCEQETFLERLGELRSIRERRNDMLIAKLQELGIPITMNEVVAQLGRPLMPDESIGRPHIADVLVRKGYAADLRDAFDRYLGEQGAAYVNPPRILPHQAVQWIREAGGTPVLAHPGLYGDDALVERIIRETNIAGIEAHHSDHSPADQARYTAMAERHGLIATAGSDFHGARQGIVFHGDIGGRTVSVDILPRLRRGER
ncbi:PHP domain-containing protein [Paenibacillus sp. MSJ-34]|uniref:PHP domain-containing protein n=1 Tax=Paenibacillus sp. MSJ-34 TaxID=2841529 RepID=UPI001C0F4410|nr:PHP domain-containing protein [Paenibacillus sp. MSJ-34]MBU5440627.1 PHP domain-containing protein [Paenibacillus sp. MSJ-34]